MPVRLRIVARRNGSVWKYERVLEGLPRGESAWIPVSMPGITCEFDEGWRSEWAMLVHGLFEQLEWFHRASLEGPPVSKHACVEPGSLLPSSSHAVSTAWDVAAQQAGMSVAGLRLLVFRHTDKAGVKKKIFPDGVEPKDVLAVASFERTAGTEYWVDGDVIEAMSKALLRPIIAVVEEQPAMSRTYGRRAGFWTRAVPQER